MVKWWGGGEKLVFPLILLSSGFCAALKEKQETEVIRSRASLNKSRYAVL